MQITDITEDTLVGQLAAAAPSTTRVFQRNGIDFCCGGGVSLGAACASRGLPFERIAAELEVELRSPDADTRSWAEAPLPELIEHILATYHRPLDEELPRIEAMARKVFEVHGDKDPERLGGLLRTIEALKAELESHMAKEEQILFPMIQQGAGAMADGPVHVMRMEHDEAGVALETLRRLTNDFTAPSEACTTWRALYAALEAFERDMHEHIHLENNILFPRALAG